MGIAEEEYFEKTLKRSETLLRKWKGATAVLWQLTVSHKSLQILLTREQGEGNLLISCLDPIRLKTPVRWKHSELEVDRKPDVDESSDGFLVSDKPAGVEVICGGIEVHEDVRLH